MLTEEPFITFKLLLERWPSMTYYKMRREIKYFFNESIHIKDAIFPVKIPKPFIRFSIEGRNPDTGKTIWDVRPLESHDRMRNSTAIYYNSTHYTLCFKLDEIKEYEKINKHVLYQPKAAIDYVPSKEARDQLQMSQDDFVRHLWKYAEELPLEGVLV